MAVQQVRSFYSDENNKELPIFYVYIQKLGVWYNYVINYNQLKIYPEKNLIRNISLGYQSTWLLGDNRENKRLDVAVMYEFCDMPDMSFLQNLEILQIYHSTAPNLISLRIDSEKLENVYFGQNYKKIYKLLLSCSINSKLQLLFEYDEDDKQKQKCHQLKRVSELVLMQNYKFDENFLKIFNNLFIRNQLKEITFAKANVQQFIDFYLQNIENKKTTIQSNKQIQINFYNVFELTSQQIDYLSQFFLINTTVQYYNNKIIVNSDNFNQYSYHIISFLNEFLISQKHNMQKHTNLQDNETFIKEIQFNNIENTFQHFINETLKHLLITQQDNVYIIQQLNNLATHESQTDVIQQSFAQNNTYKIKVKFNNVGNITYNQIITLKQFRFHMEQEYLKNCRYLNSSNEIQVLQYFSSMKLQDMKEQLIQIEQKRETECKQLIEKQNEQQTQIQEQQREIDQLKQLVNQILSQNGKQCDKEQFDQQCIISQNVELDEENHVETIDAIEKEEQ